MDTQNYPGKGLSLLQLVFALNEELKRTAHSPSYVATILNAGRADSLLSFTLEVVSQLDCGTSTALATIREWKNSFVRINRIPLDVLSLVPIHLASQSDRLRASFVCRHWRRTFLQRAELWSQLYLSKGEAYTKTLLRRVKGAALDITSTFEVPFSTMMLLSSHTEQIRYLSFVFSKWAEIEAFSELISRPLPLLHTLSINTNRERGLDRFDSALPPLLFSTAINLKALHFHSILGLPLPLGQFVFPNIVFFKFSASPPEGLRALQLLDFLEGSPMLRTVCMGIFSDISFEDVPQERVVLLPNVETFELTVSSGPGYNIATCISCPSAKSTLIAQENHDCEMIPEGAFPTLISWNTIVRQYMTSPAEEVTLEIRATSTISCNLTFRSPDNTCTRLSFIAATDDEDEDEDEDEPDLRSAEVHHEVFAQATGTIRNYPQLASIKRLHISHRFPFNPPTFLPSIVNETRKLFKTLDPLDQLTFDRCDLRPYFCLFLQAPEDHAEEPLVFPPTKELTISNPVYLSGEECITAIVGLAKSQHARGIPFGHVIVRSEIIPAEIEERLRPWVGGAEHWYEEDLDMSESDDY